MLTGLLARALELPEAPDLETLEDAFRAARDRLHALETEAMSMDATLAGHAVFRDPDRLVEAEDVVERLIARHDPPPSPSPEHRLEHIAVHLGNQIAVRAAHAVIADPGARYNPLVVHGPHGAGKSALVHAIGNALHEKSPDGIVACVSATTFVDELIRALESDRLDRWRARYRAARALIIDDVDALAGKERSQDELFSLFNHLHASGLQIVLASASPPAEMKDLEERLRSRFGGGLVVAVHPPAAAPVIADTFFLDREKIVAEWPSLDGRIIEELR
jgi:chromosomal replication initiator protein